jgi:hypothetical protein
MDNTQTLYEPAQQTGKQTNGDSQAGDPKKRDLILKDKTLLVSLKGTYIEVSNGVLAQIYGVHNLENLYIHKDIALNIGDCFTISKYLKISFIDANGNIVAKYKRVKTV